MRKLINSFFESTVNKNIRIDKKIRSTYKESKRIHDRQCGFRTQRFNNIRYKYIVLDIAKAFYRMSHAVHLNKPSICGLLASFLRSCGQGFTTCCNTLTDPY